MNNDLLEILMLAQSKVDTELALHSRRVACFSVELAKRLGHDESFQKKILIAGLLHDIGFLKIDINFSDVPLSLAKDANLALIQSHTCESEYIAKKLLSENTVLQALRSHHEKYNGEGYPDQLAGNLIPISARIIAVADLYDTFLVGEMFGAPRSTPEQARNKLSELKEHHLDPEMTDVFLDLLDENPVFYQPLENNDLELYSMQYLTTGVLKLGDLINQNGNVLLYQGATLDKSTLDKIQTDYPGQKIIVPSKEVQ